MPNNSACAFCLSIIVHSTLSAWQSDSQVTLFHTLKTPSASMCTCVCGVSRLDSSRSPTECPVNLAFAAGVVFHAAAIKLICWAIMRIMIKKAEVVEYKNNKVAKAAGQQRNRSAAKQWPRLSKLHSFPISFLASLIVIHSYFVSAWHLLCLAAERACGAVSRLSMCAGMFSCTWHNTLDGWQCVGAVPC